MRAQGRGHHGQAEAGWAYQKKTAVEAGLAYQIVRSAHPMQRLRRLEQLEAVWVLPRGPKAEAEWATAQQELAAAQRRRALEPRRGLQARGETARAAALAGRCH